MAQVAGAEHLVRNLLTFTSSTEVIGVVLRDVFGNCISWESRVGISGHRITNNRKRVWKRVINEVAGPDAVLATDFDHDLNASYKGHDILKVPWSWSESLKDIGVTTSEDAATANHKKSRRVAIKDLTPDQAKNLAKAKKLIEEHYDVIGRLVIYENLQGMASESSPLGIYDPNKDAIFIAQRALDSLSEAIHVILHEAVHRHSGHSDCTANFERALLNVAVHMMVREAGKED